LPPLSFWRSWCAVLKRLNNSAFWV
jgi:hypothetical protein